MTTYVHAERAIHRLPTHKLIMKLFLLTHNTYIYADQIAIQYICITMYIKLYIIVHTCICV